MTSKTTISIDFSDIRAIEFECRSCHAKIIAPIESFSYPPTGCSFCDSDTQWLIPGSEDFKDYGALLQIIKRLAKSKSLPFAVRLELATTISEGGLSSI